LVRHAERQAGASGYTLKSLVRLWLNMFVNFSVVPLRVSTVLGLLCSVIGAGAGLYLVIDKLIHPEIVAGFTSIIVSILLFSGVQMVMLGMIGEYLGKQFLAANQTPQFVIRRTWPEKG
jgi:undecaprenyl-phosphate 4-deoxy-4-formamido-L-arabinose transferase